MTDTRKAMQQALEALELAVRQNSHDMIMTGEELRDGEVAIKALRSALAQQGEPVSGWKLVPVEPTQEMATAGFSRNLELGGGKRNPEETYKAMLAAAPAAQSFTPDWVNYRQGVEDGKADALSQPDARKVIEQLLYCVEAWERGCLHEDYWRDRDDAIQAGQKWLEENK